MKLGVLEEILSIITIKYDANIIKMAVEQGLIQDQSLKELTLLGDKILNEEEDILYEKYFIVFTFRQLVLEDYTNEIDSFRIYK